MRNKTGKFIGSAKYVDRECLFCREKFQIKESSLKHGKGKYCKKSCCNEHKKELQKGRNNGMYGKKESEEHKKFRGQQIKNGTTKETVNRRKKSIELFVKVHGYYPGTDNASNEKRKMTWIKNYGVDHPWKLHQIRKKCDVTCLKLYGKNCWDLFVDSALYGHDTKIELKVHGILERLKIIYIPHYPILCGSSWREYDVYIPSLGLLIELDGDFWHGNPKTYYGQLYEVQIRNRENDTFKNELAKKEGYDIVRFWETDINKPEFETVFLEMLQRYGYNKN